MKRKRSYKFTAKRHSREGKISAAAGSVSFILTMILIDISYSNKGGTGKASAVLGLLTVLLSTAGVFFGRKGFQDEDCYQLFSWIGILLNLVILLFWIAVFGMGLLY
ncbi:MAG: DUF6142 family protein [Lachnospiraceae bacterium]